MQAGDPAYSSAPPPPPEVVVRPSRWRWIRRRSGGVVLEVLLAAAVLGAVALASGGTTGGSGTSRSSTSSSPSPSSAHGWPARAEPVLTALLDDLAAVDAATRANGVTAQSALAAAAASLVEDEARANRLGSPGPSLALSWRSVLGQTQIVASNLGSSSTGLSNMQASQVRSNSESAANAVASFDALLERVQP
ncbi:MAG TPA: hypothetical protein VFV02_11975 [Acidimicrobiales bacterium]|nr:hypothetical protein [Acidimicrobiales bacterium]